MAKKSYKTSIVKCSSCGTVFLSATKKDTFPTECSDCRDIQIFKPEV